MQNFRSSRDARKLLHRCKGEGPLYKQQRQGGPARGDTGERGESSEQPLPHPSPEPALARIPSEQKGGQKRSRHSSNRRVLGCKMKAGPKKFQLRLIRVFKQAFFFFFFFPKEVTRTRAFSKGFSKRFPAPKARKAQVSSSRSRHF